MVPHRPFKHLYTLMVKQEKHLASAALRRVAHFPTCCESETTLFVSMWGGAGVPAALSIMEVV